MHEAVATEFHKTINALGLPQNRLAQLFNVGARSIRRWRDGARRVPRGVDLVIRLLAAGTVTVAQVEAAAVSIPAARTNGGSQPGPAAAPEIAAPTTAEKIYRLAAGCCHWPIGDPKNSDFRFCGRPTTRGAYCEEHNIKAYLPALPRGRAALTAWKRPAVRPPPNPKTQWGQEDKDVRDRATACEAADVSQLTSV